MNSRLLAMGLLALSASLVACGGGGGGGITPSGPSPTPKPTATATPTPTPAPTNNPFGCVGQPPFTSAASTSRRVASAPHPVATGDAFTYSGSLSETYTVSEPCPQPTATTSATISVTVTNTAPPASAPSGTTDVQSVENDAYPTKTVTMTTDQIVGITATSPNQLYQLFSTSSSDGNGNTIATNYSNPQVLDKLPETTPDSWGTITSPGTNNPAATVSETLADGSTINRTIANNGTYTDTQKYTNGMPLQINVSDLSGAGTYSLGSGCGNEVDFDYAAPVNNSITLTIKTSSPDSKTGQCVTSTKTRTFPQWFTPPSVSYITDEFVDNGLQPFDGSCSVKGMTATSGEQIVETYNVLDPVLGYTEKRVTTSYVVSGYGAACVTIADTVSDYYDYSDNTTKIDYQSQNGQPASVDTINETLSMQTATCAGGSTGPCAALRRTDSVQPVSPLAVAARVAAIEQYRALQRAQKAERLHAFALHFTQKGGVR